MSVTSDGSLEISDNEQVTGQNAPVPPATDRPVSKLTLENVEKHNKDVNPAPPGSAGSMRSVPPGLPLRTGRNTPLTDVGTELPSVSRPGSGTDSLNKKDPLPPIGKKQSSEENSSIKSHIRDDLASDEESVLEQLKEEDGSAMSESDESESSFAHSGKHVTTPSTKILDENINVRDIATKKSYIAPHVDNRKPPKHPSPAKKEVVTRVNFEGKSVQMVSIDIQTDINMATTPDILTNIISKKLDDAMPNTKGKPLPGSRGPSQQHGSRAQSRQRTPDTTGLQVDTGVCDKSDIDDVGKVDEVTDVPSIPWPPRDDEFGVPLLDLSSDSDSDFEVEKTPHAGTDDGSSETDDKKDTVAYDTETLPSVGPPEILKYIRESDRLENEFGSNKILDSATCLPSSDIGLTGKCEFCQQLIKPFPTIEQQETMTPEELYCCEEYKNFVHFALNIPTDDLITKDYKIDIKPHPHYGSKQARRVAKERAAMRYDMIRSGCDINVLWLRERELMQQQQAVAAGAPAQSAFYQFAERMENMLVAKQMKTINYQLSSQKCQDEGWTMKAHTPFPIIETEPEPFEIEPLDWPEPTEELPDYEMDFVKPYDGVPGKVINHKEVIDRYYENGSKFLTVFPDGTGHVFYPSGNLAISITSTDKGLFRYVIQDDASRDNKPPILAVFEPTGIATCTFSSGKPRLNLDQLGGLEIDVHGARKRKWHWREQTTHVHAPPFQPICFALNKYLSIRVMTQENIAMQFMTKKRSCRFNVGVKLKLKNPSYLPEADIDDCKLFISEKMATIESMMDKISNLLRYPHSDKVFKIKPPLYLIQKLKKNEKMNEKVRLREAERIRKAKAAEVKPIVTVN